MALYLQTHLSTPDPHPVPTVPPQEHPATGGGADAEWDRSPSPEVGPQADAAVAAADTQWPQFQLIGTLIAPPKTPLAVVSVADTDILAAPGTAIDDHWVLRQVSAGRIVVSRGDRKLTLKTRSHSAEMAETAAAVSTAGTAPPQAPVVHAEKLARYYAGRPPQAVAFPDGLQSRGIKAVADGTYSVDVRALWEQHLRTPLYRHFEYEQAQVGMRLVEIVPGGVVDAFGFLPGDIVTRIDDTPVTRVEDLHYLLHPVGNRVKVRFIRTSTAMTHSYQLH